MSGFMTGWSIRRALYFLVLVCVLPSAAVILGYGYYEYRQAEEHFEAWASGLVYSLAEQQRGLIDDTELTLSILARVPAVQEANAAAAQELLRRVADDRPHYAYLTLAGVDGGLIASSGSRNRSLNFRERPTFQAALQQRRFSASDYTISLTTGKAALPCSYPVQDRNGEVVGVLLAGLALDGYERLLIKASLPQGARAVILDGGGHWLYRYPTHPGVVLGEGVPPAIMAKLNAQEADSGLLELPSATDPGKLISAYTRLRLKPADRPYAIIMVNIPQRVVDQVLWRSLGFTGAMLLLSLSLALAAGRVLGDRAIGEGVQKLAEAAGELARGSMGHRRGGQGSLREINELALAFDHMAAEIADREGKVNELASIVAHASDSIISTDLEGAIVSWNKGAEELYGYGPEEALGRHVSMLIPPGHPDRDLGYLAEVLAGVSIRQYETVRLTKLGVEVEVSLTISLLRDGRGEPVGVAYIARDISLRKHMEAALLESEERFTKAFMASPVPMCITTFAEGVYLEINDAYLRASGFTRQELRHRSGLDLVVWADPKDRQRVKAALSEQRGVRDLEIRGRARDGRLLDLLFSADRIQIAGMDCLLCVAVDISERKRAERQIQTSLAEKEVLLKEVHHRVKNNLAVVCSLLSLQGRTAGDPQLREFLRDSESRVRAMALVHETLYRSETLASIDLGEFLGKLARALQQTYAQVVKAPVSVGIQANGLAVELERASPLGLVICELMTNSLKYAFSEGRPGRIDIAARGDGEGGLEVVMADDGVGLPAGLAWRDAETLGLRLVLDLVEKQLKGAIALERGPGTRFRIALKPLSPRGA